MFMETVSLSDDAPAAGSMEQLPSATVVDVDALESPFAESFAGERRTKNAAIAVSVPDSREKCTTGSPDARGSSPSESASGQGHGSRVEGHVAVNVETGHKDGAGGVDQNRSHHQQQQQRPVLPPLRVSTQTVLAEDRDYVDATLFSPEVSRHAMEVAHRRAKAIANEVKELMEVEVQVSSPPKVKLSPAEAVGIISGAFVSSLQRAKQLVKPETKEYDLLSGTSPLATMSKLDDLDTDGDGLQLSPEALQSNGKHFCSQKLRPALKRLSAYSTVAALEPDKRALGAQSQKQKQMKKKIVWHEDVLDADEEFCEDDSSKQETRSLMNGDDDAVSAGSGSPPPQLVNTSNTTSEHATPQGRKKRKKLVRSMMRRLTPREKEELYRERPDLMIVPNWAQKYREDLAGEDTSRWNTGLLGLIAGLTVLLLVFVFFIVRQRAAATAA
ncbi:unnamed protein product [Hyaloperonospora brassicae]|uniref:Uncharacterized protein n=1 Tax=Hyaloperonospora brassicae TaxID=162125 RepID=A0AAV0UJL9_HYABA|nr:unnamed protein product [Hyaloperonospora brassicae]